MTAGTIFQDTRLPLRTWFRTMWWVTSQKNGASALGLQSILGLGSYRTAWALLHKLRRAMVQQPGRERLSGRVEVDETYVGGAEEGLRGRQTQKKALVAIAAEEDGAGIGRIRMKRIRGASKQQLHGFIQEAVEPDSTIHTDGWEGYVGLEALGYRHEYDFLAGSSQSASELLPHVHRVAALLKRWLIGTHQGAVSREHLDYYLDEYTFRFNRRRSRHRGKLFYGPPTWFRAASMNSGPMSTSTSGRRRTPTFHSTTNLLPCVKLNFMLNVSGAIARTPSW